MMATADLKQPMPMKVSMTGTYVLNGDAFSVKFTDMSIKSGDSTKQALIDAGMASMKQTQLDAMNKGNGNGKVTWKSDDEIVVTDSSGKPQSFTRVKS